MLERITEGNNKNLKTLYGGETDVLQKQALRYTAILNKFQETYKSDQVAIFSSPGRSEIGGNHTDHNHGRLLAGAVNLDNIAAAAKNSTNIINILSAEYPPFKVDLSRLNPDEKEFYTSASLVRGIC